MTLSAAAFVFLPFELVSLLEPVEVAATNSLSAPFLSPSFLLVTSCCVFASSSLYAQDGKSCGAHRSSGNVVAYCALSSVRPALSISFGNKLGFFKAELLASFALKCMPRFFRLRKCSTFVSTSADGEPGGDGGILRLGVGGSVSDRRFARLAKYGELGTSADGELSIVEACIEGPTAGPGGACSSGMEGSIVFAVSVGSG